MTFKLFMHHIYFCSIFFVLTCNLPLVFLSVLLVLFLCLCPYPSTMPRKTRANRTPSFSSVSPSRSQLFKIWADHSIVLDEVDPAIRANLESRGWLPLLEVDHPPPTAMIREFFSNLSCHVYDSNTLVRSWIRGVEFTITPRVVANALGVPVIQEPVYPYEESPPLNDVMSNITGSSI